MKKLTFLFGFGLCGVLFCLAMTLWTGLRLKQEERKDRPTSVPTPVLSQ